MSGEPKGLSYVVPCYNEEGAVRRSLERLSAVLGKTGLEHEIIVVNDGSRDNSAKIAAEVPGVRVISHPVNSGYGAAIKTGIRNARFAWIGIVDADGTYPIEELPRLIDGMEQGFDMVVAQRQNVQDLDSPVKRLFRGIFIRVVSLLLGRKVRDPNSGFRVFRKDMATLFLPFLCHAFSFTTSITVFAFGQGMFISYVPIDYSARVGKSKVRHIRDSIRTAQLVLQGVMYFNPFKFALITAGLFLLFGAAPGAILGLLGYVTAGWFVFWSMAVVAALLLMGLLFDMLRIAIIQTNRPDDPMCFF
ncbi:MAG: glycosyltransferase family 2 protein [Alphaproteobacteria bacterium]|nr:glycosyltransferase family 2 protein [Alphaproteobacteria bacterium]MBF0129924.1 glycosyltransferase family 2 protein [Alphaproteobacteria bacterium]